MGSGVSNLVWSRSKSVALRFVSIIFPSHSNTSFWSFQFALLPQDTPVTRPVVPLLTRQVSERVAGSCCQPVHFSDLASSFNICFFKPAYLSDFPVPVDHLCTIAAETVPQIVVIVIPRRPLAVCRCYNPPFYILCIFGFLTVFCFRKANTILKFKLWRYCLKPAPSRLPGWKVLLGQELPHVWAKSWLTTRYEMPA